jgi:hypothetical protein
MAKKVIVTPQQLGRRPGGTPEEIAAAKIIADKIVADEISAKRILTPTGIIGRPEGVPQRAGLGRRFSPSQQDLGFLMRHQVGLEFGQAPRVLRKTWAITPRSLNQGETGTCVGHAWKNFLRCAPMQSVKSGPSAWDIYRAAVLHDEWTDNDAESKLPDNSPKMQAGTCVRSGAQELVRLNKLTLFLWAFEIQPVINWVLTKGPMVLGINWYDSMFEPDANGLITITENAHIAGGHALLLRGIDLRKKTATLENSWGDAWGLNGSCFIQLADLERLLAEDGEAAAAVELKQ